jgi:adenine-specific DNA-methyltransferase
MDKLNMHTPSLADANYTALAKLFPNAVTETIDESGVVVRAIDKDVLAQEINAHVVEGREERYQFTWPDKRKSILLANAPIAAALRPCREESVDFDTTENLYIEGDNLDVLKLLRETYLNRVKMIYIDPPYNTGHDFVYEDDFAEDAGDFLRRDGQYDEQGNRLAPNLDSNGRFHTDWLNMIYPRLRVARDLLSEDGVIFISIDDNEFENCKKICNEVFGSENAVATIVWKRKRGRDNSARWFSKAHEYLVVYAKQLARFDTNYLELDEETKGAYKNPDNDPRGIWRMLACWARGTQGGVKYDFTTKDGQYFSERLWLFSKKNLEQLDNDNKLVIRGDNVYRKMFITENRGKIPETLWDSVSNAANAADEIKRLFDETIVFDTPKPIPYVKEMLKIASNPYAIILDFFSGSATTAHAVMQLNAEDGGKRRFIMVQLPEVTDENSEAAKAGYKNICEIGKERIRRAGAKIKAEFGMRNAEKNVQTSLMENSEFRTPNSEFDIGFRVLKLDTSNMKDVYYTPEEYTQIDFSLDGLADNIKEDRTGEDLLFQVMLDLGIPLSAKIQQEGDVFYVNETYLIACFGRVDTDLITEIAKQKPYYAVFRDSSFASDSAMVNFEQVFNTYSPSTIRRVL